MHTLHITRLHPQLLYFMLSLVSIIEYITTTIKSLYKHWFIIHTHTTPHGLAPTSTTSWISFLLTHYNIHNPPKHIQEHEFLPLFFNFYTWSRFMNCPFKCFVCSNNCSMMFSILQRVENMEENNFWTIFPQGSCSNSHGRMAPILFSLIFFLSFLLKYDHPCIYIHVSHILFIFTIWSLKYVHLPPSSFSRIFIYFLDFSKVVKDDHLSC